MFTGSHEGNALIVVVPQPAFSGVIHKLACPDIGWGLYYGNPASRKGFVPIARLENSVTLCNGAFNQTVVLLKGHPHDIVIAPPYDQS